MPAPLLALAWLALAGAALSDWHSVDAQATEPMTITFPPPSEVSAVGALAYPAGTSAAEALGNHMAIFADEVLCIEGDPAAPNGLAVGAPDQPAVCRLIGAQLTFIYSAGSYGVTRSHSNPVRPRHLLAM